MARQIREHAVVTRKPHRCFGCLETIPQHTKAIVSVNEEDGVTYSLYMHPACHEIMPDTATAGDEEYWEGCVANYLDEIGFKGSPDEYLSGLRASA